MKKLIAATSIALMVLFTPNLAAKEVKWSDWTGGETAINYCGTGMIEVNANLMVDVTTNMNPNLPPKTDVKIGNMYQELVGYSDTSRFIQCIRVYLIYTEFGEYTITVTQKATIHPDGYIEPFHTPTVEPLEDFYEVQEKFSAVMAQ